MAVHTWSTQLRYLSVCSGIEAATVAWHPLGWKPVAFSEIEPFPAAVLAHHYPDVPNYGDMTKFQEWPIEPGTVDLLVGGTPCQSFSVAGLRKGISDPRGGLMLTYLEIARRFRPRWVVWENVPGVLSSNGGRDFGSFLGALSELRYGWAYRVIDAQYCRVDRRWPKAVPQRRRRVFVVGCDLERDPRGRERAAEVLAIGQGLRWHLAESGKTRKAAAADAEAGVGAGCWWDGSDCAGTLTKQNANRAQRMPDKDNFGAVLQPVPYDLFQITAPVNRQNRKPGDPCHTLARDNAAHAAVAFTDAGQGQRIRPTDQSSETLRATKRGPYSDYYHAMSVRRLTPKEAERLQGFPDDYTAIPWRGKPADQCPDGPRYKALGNSMACNCMAWIGERIAAVDSCDDI